VFCLVPGEHPTPADWICLLENPCQFLGLANLSPCNGSWSNQHVSIVGAGMAGLTLAWIIVQLNISVAAALLNLIES
jgi:hypothetical protein